MALTKFIYVPDSSSYSVADGIEVLSTKLDGGASRYRKDILGATSTVDCTWILGQTDYKYFRAFFRALTEKGATPFLIDLILDEPALTEHKAYFIPSSIRLTGTQGNIFWVSAQLEVYPAEMDKEAAIEFVNLTNILGRYKIDTFPYLEDIVDTIINTNLPEYL